MDLKEKILQALKDENLESVPALASKLGVPVTPELISTLWELKKEKLIHWQIGEYIKISSQGFEHLLSKAANQPA